jgi:(1->4)-alpha-D-glucan 1-alpha-D-glucosylmutase
MTSTSTHDTKLGEDVRARISVLSQIPGEWRKQVARWTRINTASRTTVWGTPAPERNDEYRFYQVLVGVWPSPGSPPDQALVKRVRDYMMKAIKEAKVHTSWVNDNEAYDRATASFVERVLTGHAAPRFLASFLPFQERVARLALANSLSQLLLKIASPGVPDFYQGTELWDLHLVDPDNRAPVDFEQRACLLDELEPHLPVALDGSLPAGASSRQRLEHLLEHWPDGRIKLWVTACGLRVRRARRQLFVAGRYVPLVFTQAATADVVAFARQHESQAAIAVAPRLLARTGSGWREWAAAWGEARLRLPADLGARRWVDAFTGDRVRPKTSTAQRSRWAGSSPPARPRC